ncbi:MAG: hypothetical protein ABFR97_01690 [Thermodesulfobacteriota bacterium]
MNDFAVHYSLQKKRNMEAVSWRHISRADKRGGKVIAWRIMGSIVVCSIFVAIISSFWVGHCIQQGLRSVAQAQDIQGQERQIHADLLAERAIALAAGRLHAKAAVQVGLYAPGQRQEVGLP